MYRFHPASAEHPAMHEYGNEEYRLLVHVQELGLMVTVMRLGAEPQVCQFVTTGQAITELANGVAGLLAPDLVQPDDIVTGAPVLVLYPPGKPFDVPVIRFSDERWVVPGQGHKGYLLQAVEAAWWPRGKDMRELAREQAQ